ncbi:MAG: hypothetical protein K2K56_04715 [Lachnospiraceae bacterium]|nr:hypothetical protein [Lachnospiraceae bacterium]MDE6625656.1 hypothetical protein [Lachnospiraceae bacterium]
MNNTDKAKLDAARRMLKGRIDINEVAMLLELSEEQLKPIKDELDEEMKKIYGSTAAYDMDTGEVLFDNFDDIGADDDLPNEDNQ